MIKFIQNIIIILHKLRHFGKAMGVEVKSADNTKSKSLNTLMGYYGVEKGIKLSAKSIGGKDKIESPPLYMAIFL